MLRLTPFALHPGGMVIRRFLPFGPPGMPSGFVLVFFTAFFFSVTSVVDADGGGDASDLLLGTLGLFTFFSAELTPNDDDDDDDVTPTAFSSPSSLAFPSPSRHSPPSPVAVAAAAAATAAAFIASFFALAFNRTFSPDMMVRRYAPFL